MKMVFVVGMFIRKFWNCTSPSTLRFHPKVKLCFHSLLVASQRYTLMGKNKKRDFKNYTHDQAQTFAYNTVIRKVT
jgi:hypothetical protein